MTQSTINKSLWAILRFNEARITVKIREKKMIIIIIILPIEFKAITRFLLQEFGIFIKLNNLITAVLIPILKK